jgi:hypothetical protein
VFSQSRRYCERLDPIRGGLLYLLQTPDQEGPHLPGRTAQSANNSEPTAGEVSAGTSEGDAVVGAGFAGMCMLYRLREMGLSTRVFETGDGVGGIWYWNRYPWARVDAPSINRGNVTLVDVRANPIVEVTRTGVLLADGTDHAIDVLVFAAGFDAVTGLLLRMNIFGEGDLSLENKWSAGPKIYLGIATVGFPNMFMITGPGSPSVLSNMMTFIEQHVDWISDTVKYLKGNRIDSIEATQPAEDTWVEHVNEVASKTLHFRANSWYLSANIPGQPRVFMPYVNGVGNYRQKCDQVASNDYEGFALHASGAG